MVKETIPSKKEVQLTEPISKKLTRAPRSTSLKGLMAKEPEVAYQNLNNENSDLRNYFKTEDLLRCWDFYSQTLEKKAHLQNTMFNCKPVLLDDFHFEVVVHNPGQQEELINHSIELLRTLRFQLKNNQIQMHIRIDETNEKKLAYTSTEKYEFLNSLNPLLSKLRDEYDLTID